MAFALRDRSGLSDVVLTLSEPALHILAMMDGGRTCGDIVRESGILFGRPLATETLQKMLDHLEQAHFLEGPGFESYYRSLLDDYHKEGTRSVRDPKGLGLTDGTGVLFEEMLAGEKPVALPGPVVGLVAPHLDYRRGRPAYAAAYATLRDRATPQRVVVLGTNHFGHSNSAVATSNDFATPLGTTRSDVSFLERIEAACGDLRTYELDHLREHSIELQVAWLQHMFGPENFRIVPLLCPDPCGPTGTAPVDGRGVDLGELARVLGELLANDPVDTLIVAGADLSHVGRAFGEDPPLTEALLEEVRRQDSEALERLCTLGPDDFVRCIAEKGNPTRICSAGCVFALATALGDARATILTYHQAVDQPTQTGVTCAAMAFT